MICKRCGQSEEKHMIVGNRNPNNFNIPYAKQWCFERGNADDFWQPVDNLDYVEWLAKAKNLI